MLTMQAHVEPPTNPCCDLAPLQDNVSPVSDAKRTATLVAVLTAILILVPMVSQGAG